MIGNILIAPYIRHTYLCWHVRSAIPILLLSRISGMYFNWHVQLLKIEFYFHNPYLDLHLWKFHNAHIHCAYKLILFFCKYLVSLHSFFSDDGVLIIRIFFMLSLYLISNIFRDCVPLIEWNVPLNNMSFTNFINDSKYYNKDIARLK